MVEGKSMRKTNILTEEKIKEICKKSMKNLKQNQTIKDASIIELEAEALKKTYIYEETLKVVDPKNYKKKDWALTLATFYCLVYGFVGFLGGFLLFVLLNVSVWLSMFAGTMVSNVIFHVFYNVSKRGVYK